jgi:hypothetical protein
VPPSKKGFFMNDMPPTGASPWTSLQERLIPHRNSIYSALTEHSPECMSRLVAEELLRAAHWDSVDFRCCYELGLLDG